MAQFLTRPPSGSGLAAGARPLLRALLASAWALSSCGDGLTFEDVRLNQSPSLWLDAEDVTEGEPVVLRVTTADPNGNRVRVSFTGDFVGGLWAETEHGGGTEGESSEHTRPTTCEDLGEYVIGVRASDGLASVEKEVTVAVLHTEDPPQFDADRTPPTAAFVGIEYTYRARAFAANECDAVQILFQQGPTGMEAGVVGRGSGMGELGLTWEPQTEHAGGRTPVRLVAVDAAVRTDVLEWEIVVDNSPPVNVLVPEGKFKVGVQGTVDCSAEDREGHGIHWQIAGGPDGMMIDRDRGVITWTPGEDQEGVHAFSVRAVDELDLPAPVVESTAYVWKDLDADGWCTSRIPGEDPPDEWCTNGFSDCDDDDRNVHEGC